MLDDALQGCMSHKTVKTLATVRPTFFFSPFSYVGSGEANRSYARHIADEETRALDFETLDIFQPVKFRPAPPPAKKQTVGRPPGI